MISNSISDFKKIKINWFFLWQYLQLKILIHRTDYQIYIHPSINCISFSEWKRASLAKIGRSDSTKANVEVLFPTNKVRPHFGPLATQIDGQCNIYCKKTHQKIKLKTFHIFIKSKYTNYIIRSYVEIILSTQTLW